MTPNKWPFLLLIVLFSVSRIELSSTKESESNDGNDSSSSAHRCSNHQNDNDEQLKRRIRESSVFDPNPRLIRTQKDRSRPTLRQVLLIHRHGDRTPIKFNQGNCLQNEPFWSFFGYSQLTNRGKARLLLLGQLIRKRYEKFLGGSVNKNIRASWSSGALRCIESGQLFLAGLLPLNLGRDTDAELLTWNSNNQLGGLWQPANIRSVPRKMDALLAEHPTCNELEREYKAIGEQESAKQIMKEFSSEAKLLQEILGFRMKSFSEFSWASSQLEVEMTFFKDKIDPRLQRARERIDQAGMKAFTASKSTNKSRRLRCGLLMNHMIEQMKKTRRGPTAGNPDPFELKKFIHYSSHDTNLVVLLGMLEAWQEDMKKPHFGGHIILELHQDQTEWFVRTFYTAQVPGRAQEIHLASCEKGHPQSRCTLDAFEDFMRPYLVTSWQKWMQECDNDPLDIDPYEEDT